MPNWYHNLNLVLNSSGEGPFCFGVTIISNAPRQCLMFFFFFNEHNA